MTIDLKKTRVTSDENKDRGGWLIFFFSLKPFVCYLLKKNHKTAQDSGLGFFYYMLMYKRRQSVIERILTDEYTKRQL